MTTLQNHQDLYENAFQYWAQEVSSRHWARDASGVSVILSNPLFNDHKKFRQWLMAEYGIQVRNQSLNPVMEFPDAVTETWFMLRYI